MLCHQLVYCKLVYHIHVLTVVCSQLGMVYTITDFSCYSYMNTRLTLRGPCLYSWKGFHAWIGSWGHRRRSLGPGYRGILLCLLGYAGSEQWSGFWSQISCRAYLPDLHICLHQHHCRHCPGCPAHRRRVRGVPTNQATLSCNEKGFHYETKCEQGVPRILQALYDSHIICITNPGICWWHLNQYLWEKYLSAHFPRETHIIVTQVYTLTDPSGSFPERSSSWSFSAFSFRFAISTLLCSSMMVACSLRL